MQSWLKWNPDIPLIPGISQISGIFSAKYLSKGHLLKKQMIGFRAVQIYPLGENWTLAEVRREEEDNNSCSEQIFASIESKLKIYSLHTYS